MFSLADLSVCVRRAAESTTLAHAAARALLRRCDDALTSDAQGMLERLVAFGSTCTDADIERLERNADALRVTLADGSHVWLAPHEFPALVPPGPTFSYRGLHALARALIAQLEQDEVACA